MLKLPKWGLYAKSRLDGKEVLLDTLYMVSNMSRSLDRLGVPKSWRKRSRYYVRRISKRLAFEIEYC